MTHKMQKVATLVLSALLLSVSASAANNWTDDVVVEAGKGTPVVDGVVNEGEWFGAQELTITLDDPVVNEFGEYQGNWANEKPAGDFSASMYFMWDEEALYILDKRVDDHTSLAGDGTQPWAGSDGNLVFLQTIDSFESGNDEAWSHHIFYIVGDGADANNYGGTAWVRVANGSTNTQETVKRDQIKTASAAIDGGWVMEVKVPWTVFEEEIPDFFPEDDAVIGMSLVPIDNDADGDYSQISWFKVADALGVQGGYDYGGWATLKLLPAPVVETEAEVVDTEAGAATAPQTFDAGVIAAVAAIVSAAGYAVSKKR